MHNVLEKHEKFSGAGGGTKRIPRRAKEPPGVQMRVATDEIRVRMWVKPMHPGDYRETEDVSEALLKLE